MSPSGQHAPTHSGGYYLREDYYDTSDGGYYKKSDYDYGYKKSDYGYYKSSDHTGNKRYDNDENYYSVNRASCIGTGSATLQFVLCINLARVCACDFIVIGARMNIRSSKPCAQTAHVLMSFRPFLAEQL